MMDTIKSLIQKAERTPRRKLNYFMLSVIIIYCMTFKHNVST